MMFALLGIREMCEQGDELAADLFRKGTNAVLASLDRFDGGDWSCYDDAGKRASGHYHDIHIEQLRRLHECTQNALFQAYADRFSRYLALHTR